MEATDPDSEKPGARRDPVLEAPAHLPRTRLPWRVRLSARRPIGAPRRDLPTENGRGNRAFAEGSGGGGGGGEGKSVTRLTPAPRGREGCGARASKKKADRQFAGAQYLQHIHAVTEASSSPTCIGIWRRIGGRREKNDEGGVEEETKRIEEKFHDCVEGKTFPRGSEI